MCRLQRGDGLAGGPAFVLTTGGAAPGFHGNVFENIAPELAGIAQPCGRSGSMLPNARRFIQGFVDSDGSFRIWEGRRAQEHAFDDGRSADIAPLLDASVGTATGEPGGLLASGVHVFEVGGDSQIS